MGEIAKSMHALKERNAESNTIALHLHSAVLCALWRDDFERKGWVVKG